MPNTLRIADSKLGVIVLALPIVVPEGLLIEVTEEMERFNAHIGPADATLQEPPKVFEAICVYPPFTYSTA